jgi:hypothetical protein
MRSSGSSGKVAFGRRCADAVTMDEHGHISAVISSPSRLEDV